jgi:hypothetical protein
MPRLTRRVVEALVGEAGAEVGERAERYYGATGQKFESRLNHEAGT